MPKKTTKKTAGRPRSGRFPTAFENLKSAALLVSLAFNAAILIGWVLLRLSDKYDEQVARFIFGA